MKRKKLPTRRRRALRRVVWALLLLLAVNHFFQVGYLLPGQAVRDEEEREGTGRTWAVESRWMPVLYRTHRFSLRENENAVLLGNTYFSPFGWQTTTGCALDCSEAAAVHAAEHRISRDGKGTVDCYFGRIDDPAIERVAVSIQEVTYDQGQETRRELRRLTAERSEFLTRDGRTFFWLMEVQDGEIDPEQIIQPVLIAWGENGTVVAEFTIRQGSFGSYG